MRLGGGLRTVRCGESVGAARGGAGVLPPSRDRAVHALDHAVLPRAEGPSADVADPGGPEQLVKLAAEVAHPVVGHGAPDGDAQASKKRGQRAMKVAQAPSVLPQDDKKRSIM